jgi:signal transduction histidine kinase
MNLKIILSLTLLSLLFVSCNHKDSNYGISPELQKWANYSFKSAEWKAANPDSLKYFGEQILSQTESEKFPFWKAKGNYLIGDYYYRKTEYLESISYTKKALDIALLVNDSITINSSYLLLGIAYFNLGRLGESERELNAGLRYSLKLKDTTKIIHYYSTLGTLTRDLEDLEKASMYIAKALILSELVKNEHVIAVCKRDLAVVMSERSDSNKVLLYLREAAAIFHKLSDTIAEAEIDIEYGFYYYHKKPDSALYFFQKASNVFSKMKDKQMLLVANHNIATLFFDHGKYNDAIKIFQETYQQSLLNGDLTGQSRGLISLLSSAIKTKDLHFADSLIKIGEELAPKLKSPTFVLDLVHNKIDFLCLTGNKEQVIELYEEQIYIKNSLQSSQNKEITNLIHNQLDNERKNHEIDLLRHNSILQDTKAKIQMKLMIIMGVFILLSILMIGIIISYYRKNLKILEHLERSEKELIQSNTDKDKFFSIIAHDLKNPFNTILGFSELLYEELEKGNTTQVKEYLSFISRATIQANSLLENLLIWARSQNKSLIFKPQLIALTACIQENIRNVEIQAIAKKIEITIMVEDEANVWADKNMFDTIIRNLLSNAIKFSFENGIVQITTKQSKGMIDILVKDSGVGISQNRLEGLFNTTTSISTAGTSNEVGSGLGLVLCKEFAEKNGGSIQVESTEGSGALFIVSVPKAT